MEKTPLDSINTYSATEQSFNQLKDCFRSVISDIDKKNKNELITTLCKNALKRILH